MSTNKTENYQLHAWEPQDDFLLQEINDNFAALDGVLGGLITTGAYQGDDGVGREIILGFRPRAVLVLERKGTAMNGSIAMGGLAVEGSPAGYDDQYFSVAITEDGFQVSNTSAPSLVINTNHARYQYQYLALA